MGQCDVNETVQAGGQAALDGPLSAPTPATEPKGKARGKGPTAAKKTASPSRRPPPHAKQMMDLAEQHRAELFTSAGDGFAAVDISKRRATLRIESAEFAKLLRCWLYEAQQTVASAQAVAEAQATLAARARYTGSEQPVYLRTGKAGDALYLDLGTADGQAVEVTPQGWRVIPRPPVHFLRPAGMQPLPMPVRGGNLAELFVFINPPEDCRPLLLAWLMFALSPDGPFPLLAVHGEQGSGKTTGCRMLRALVDPHSAGLRGVPRDDRSLMISTRHGWLLGFDNLSSLPPWLSDLLCGIATGTATAARSLYTDDGEALFQAKRPILLNGIEEVATRADLLDRCLVVSFQTIPEERRRSEAELWAAFQTARPRIFGALLDALACALRQLPQVKLPRSPRMVDFATWATAAESALGLPSGGFLDAYFQNIRAACDLPIEASAIAGPLQALLKQQGQTLDGAAPCWTGTATELLKELRAVADDEVKRQSNWPRNPQLLSGELKRLAPNFRQKGVHIEHGRSATAKRTRGITVRGEPC